MFIVNLSQVYIINVLLRKRLYTTGIVSTMENFSILTPVILMRRLFKSVKCVLSVLEELLVAI